MKMCWGCGYLRPFTAFAKNARKVDGLQTQCKDCMNFARKQWDLRNAAYVKQRSKEKWSDTEARGRYDAWRAENQQTINARNKQWANTNRSKARASVNAWDRANKPRKVQQKRMRKGMQERATPAWANHEAMQQYYVLARFLTCELGIDFHVDHVVPIKSDIVCGLHSHTNLAISIGAWNIAKHNRYWPDMPNDALSVQD